MNTNDRASNFELSIKIEKMMSMKVKMNTIKANFKNAPILRLPHYKHHIFSHNLFDICMISRLDNETTSILRLNWSQRRLKF